MTDKTANETAIMAALVSRLQRLNVPYQKEEITAGQDSIVAQFNVRKNSDLILEYTFNFVPDLLQLTPNFLNFQSFVYISGLVTDESGPALRSMVSKINPFIPIGSFGIIDRFGILYWKQNNYLDGYTEPNHNASLILAQTVFSQEVILDFQQTFLNVISKRMGAEESLRANKWASTIFGNH